MIRLTDPVPIAAMLATPACAPMDHGFAPAVWIADARNVALADGESIGLFGWTGGHVYDAHWMLAARGAAALRIARTMLEAMYLDHGALAIRGMTPVENRAARLFNRWLGGKSLGIIDTVRGPHELFFQRRETVEKEPEKWAA